MIRFPQKHVADIVAERIMQVQQKMTSNSVSAQGQRLEQALQQPVGDIAAMDGVEDAITLKALDL